MVAYYYYPIALALIFIGIGFFFYQRWKVSKTKNLHRSGVQRVLAILLIIAGFAVAVGVIAFSPSPSSRRALITGSLHSPAADVDEVDIKPYPGPDHTSLTAAPIAIRDRGDIIQITAALDRAASFWTNHPVERWSAWITIKTKKFEYNFIVVQTSDTTNGTIIYLKSGLTEGWTIATFRSDQFGGILERLTHGIRP